MSALRLSRLVFCLFALAAGAFSPLPALAAEATAPTSAAAALSSPQGQFVQALGDKAISILSSKELSKEARDAKFREMLRDSFDLPTIGRFVIGRSWVAATPEQQKTYMDLFEALVVKTYSERFALYTGEGFKVRAMRPESDKDFMVNSDITHPDGSAPTTVDWRLRQKDGKFGIIDVIVEGVSMSQTQRQEYASIIQRNGGEIAPLLDMMRARVQATATASK